MGARARTKPSDPLVAAVDSLFELARARARRRGIPFTLSPADKLALVSSRVCPATGLPFVLGAVRDNSRPHPMSPSLDRIDSSRGYVRGNVRLVSCWANSARNNLSDAQFAVMIEATHRIIQSAALQ